jgi:N,N'-diacetyllegionaminate synthase
MNKTFIIAEAGVNHNGSIEMAIQMIDVAVAAGADAVKFQTFNAEKLVTGAANKAEYQIKNTGNDESQLEMLKKLELTVDDHRELLAYCKSRNILFLSTPFDEESADMLDDLGLEVFKVGSGEITNKPLLQHIARKNKPMIISTGMSYLGEVAKCLHWIEEARISSIEIMIPSDDRFSYPLVLLHCVTNYPALPDEVNLLAMRTMREAFHLPVGYSDHTMGIEISVAAAAIGAVVLEKHLTLSHDMEGPDHKASLEPQEFSSLVNAIRSIEMAMGDGVKKPSKSEFDTRKIARRSLVALKDIGAQEKLTTENIAIKRPGIGIQPEFREMIVGMRAKRHINADAIIEWRELEFTNENDN